MKKSTHTIFVAVIILAFFIAGCQMEKQPTKIGELTTAGDAFQGTPTPALDVLYQVGDIVRVDQTVLVVLGWDQPPGGDLNPPDAGKKYLVVDLLIANQGDRSFNVSPVFQMSLKSPQGQKYNVNGKASLASGSNPPNGEVNPGEVVRGKVGFQVPQDMTGFTFVFEAKLIGLGEVSIALGNTPLAIDPPSDLNLANQQKTYQIGDLIEISGVAIQVLGTSHPAGTEIIQPRQGYHFVGVEVQVENRSESVQEINSVVQMYLKDSSGQKYTFHLGAQSLLDSGLPDDELQPGERVRGEIGFQVPDNAGGLIFVFDAEIFGYGKAFIALN
jgi:hypothetical protein